QHETEGEEQRREQYERFRRLRQRAQPWLEHEAPGRPPAAAVAPPPRVPRLNLPQRLTAGDAGLQSTDEAEADRVLLSLPGGTKLAGDGERRPEIERRDHQASKAVRHDPDDLEARAVDQDRTREHIGIAAKPRGPGAVADDHDQG